jgi:hypothetical protein
LLDDEAGELSRLEPPLSGLDLSELPLSELALSELRLSELDPSELRLSEVDLSEPCLEVSFELEAGSLDPPPPPAPSCLSPLDFAESRSLPLPLPFVELESEEWLRFDGPPLRSFFAQPEPLKWIVGGLNDLRSVPTAPQTGQAAGGPPLIEWTISLVRPQFEQM